VHTGILSFSLLVNKTTATDLSTGWAKKTAHGFRCYNFAYSQSFIIIFEKYTL